MEDGVALRDSQCIVVDTEGLLGGVEFGLASDGGMVGVRGMSMGVDEVIVPEGGGVCTVRG